MGTNNLGRTNVVLGQSGKEVTIAASDDAIDAAITNVLTLTWSGAEALKTLSTAQLQGAAIFVMGGTTTEVAPVLKMASVQRGMVLVKNDLPYDLVVTDYTSATSILIPNGETHAVYVAADLVIRIFEGGTTPLPADTSLLTCRVATTGNVTIATALNSGDSIDGVTLADGDRVLVWKQTTASENGIWIVDAVPFRATDFDETAEVLAGTLIPVNEGSTHADKLFMLTTNNPVTVNTTLLTFKALTGNATPMASEAQMWAGTNSTRALSPSVFAGAWKKGSNIASAATLSVGSGGFFRITGTTTITDIDFTDASLDGRTCVLEFAAALTLTHGANLVLPTAANITTAAGDKACFMQYNGDEVHCLWYSRADGTAILSTAFVAASTAEVLGGADNTKGVTALGLEALWGKMSTIASAGTLVIGDGGYAHVSGTTGISDIDFDVAHNGRSAVLVFDGILTLTHNATSLILPGAADIVTAAGDRAAFVQDASDNIICLWYTRADGTSIVNSGFTAASNTQTLTGTNTTRGVTPDSLAALWEKGGAIASAATITIGEGRYFHITGTTGISDIDWSVAKDGREAILYFDNVLTLTHNATTLKLPGGADITTAAGDRACFIQDDTDNVVCLWYTRADGTALVASGTFTAASTTEVLTGTDNTKGVTADALAALWEKGSDTASAATVSLGEGGLFHITGTTGISDIDWATAKDGRMAWVVFDGILTLTHNGTTLKLPTAANITTAAGDRALFVQDSSDNVICLSYTRADGTPLVGAVQPKEMIVACSDETTLITTGTGKVKFRAPRAMTLTGIKASLTAAATSGTVTIDVNLNGSTIMATNKLNFDANETTTTTYSGTAAALSTTAVSADDEFTIDFDSVGTGGTPSGVKVTLLYT